MKELSPLCQALVRSIASNTTDPDPIQKTLFVDTRHVFLEMCQFLHYQFDTLRRSKHSSLMLLYHLHHPDDDNMRPTCVTCDTYIRDVRFHCDVCHTDLCSTCFNAANPPHPHALTPFRVTLIQTGSS
jgi:E1A/CREB-binding protein